MTAPDKKRKDLSYFTGLIIGVFVLTALRAWLVSLCSAIFFPAFVLGFWQWFLLVFTFRLMIPLGPSSDD